MRIFDRKTGKEVTDGQEPPLEPWAKPLNPPVPAPEPEDKDKK